MGLEKPAEESPPPTESGWASVPEVCCPCKTKPRAVVRPALESCDRPRLPVDSTRSKLDSDGRNFMVGMESRVSIVV